MKLFIFAALIFFCAFSMGICQTVEIEPDPTVQKRIDEIALRLMHARTQVEVEDSLEVLRQFEKAQNDKTALMRQVLYYLRHGANTEDRGYGAMVLFNKLDVDKPARVRAALSYLDAQDTGSRKIATEVLGTVDSPDGEGVDYSVYRELLCNSVTNPPQVLVRYMYTKSPDAALSSMATVYLDKNEAKTLVDQVKSEDEVQAVDRLSKRPEWWAKLYAAEKIKQNPKLRTPAVIERLKQSEHILVKEAVEKIDKK